MVLAGLVGTVVEATDRIVGPGGASIAEGTSTLKSGHHRLEGLFEIREFSHEVLGEHQVFHVLKIIREAIDEDHVRMFSMDIRPVPSESKIAMKESF